MSVETFLRSGFNFKDSEYELKLQYRLSNIMLSSVIITLGVLSIVRFFQRDYLQSAVDAIVIIFSALTILYIRKSKFNIHRVATPFLFLLLLLASYSFQNVGMFILGASWYIVLLITTFFLLGIRIGLIFSIASIFSLSILSFTGNTEYTVYQYFYVLTPMLMSILLIYLYERRNTIIKELLYKKNHSLEEDIELKSQEQIKLLQKSHNLAQIVEKSNIELYIVDLLTDHFIYVNKGVTDALGYTEEEMLQKSVYDINPFLTVETVERLKEASLHTENIMNITEHQRKDGTTYGVQSYIHSITYDNRDAYVIYDIKISDEKKAQEEILQQKQSLAKQAHYDTLTSLPNRTLFYDRLSQAITKSRRSDKEFALMFIDLDKFKEINDTLGHDVGDLVLIEIASRLQKSLREVDTVARLAGDEFLIILEDIDSKDAVTKIVQKLIEKISAVIVLDHLNLYVTASIGISIYPDHTEDPKVLVKHADQAMYKAKDIGKNNFQFYNG